jgi:xanthine dehydrogenase accessory factor
VKRAVLEAVVAARRAKRPVVVVTPLDCAGVRGGEGRVWSPGDRDVAGELADAAARALSTDDAVTVDTAAGPVFLQPMNPALRLVIVGAVHIAEALSSVAALLGYDVTIVDPRRAFAHAERWDGHQARSGVVVRAEWPDEALPALGLDARTAVVALTHDPKIDDPALVAALRSRAFYVGALGSRKTQAARLLRLAAEGIGEADRARVHGPIGLAIGARSPAEIAVAIAAQMTDRLRRGSA